MRIEHAGIQVKDPAAMADWYVAQLGFKCVRSADTPVPVRFIADESGRVMLEVYHNPDIGVPDYAVMDPLHLHVAFVRNDPGGTAKRLVRAGAALVSGPEIQPNGDELVMLRDPCACRFSFAAAPLRAAARRPAGFVARSLHAAEGMLVARASPAGLGASSKVGLLFRDRP